ncbi:MAG TPA: sigma 54-interacting transcriptional regulator, partial [Rhizomicrobium sp.]|nr:sigma 54-interacting transcriptional regulator [Rhizomicrobium sp.]
ELLASASGELVVNQYPIAEDEQLNRVLVTLQTASSLKGTEQKIRLKEAERKGFYAKYTFDDFVTRDAEMKTRLLLAQTYAATEATILVLGENGTGKEIVAQSIHNASPRRHGPFVAVNCGAIPAPILESELFGYVDGAFSGASRKGKAGLFELAHNGTLYLDEVADMPLETQGKILRVLIDQTFTRVGGQVRVQVDARVICSTTRDLRAETEAGRFREDLYHRLNVVPVRVPSLAERRDDIPVLVSHFMKRLSAAGGLPARQIGDDAMAVLQTHGWPGNVRQLRNIVERLLILASDDVHEAITADLLPSDLGSGVGGNKSGDLVISLPLREAREIFERDYLMAQINRFGGNISRTAAFIGMERSALHRKLKSLGVGSMQGIPN